MSATTEAMSRTITPTSQPISLLPSSAARTYSHVHPVLLSTYYYLRFSSLVADPVPTLTTDLLPICLLQLSYAVICLPPTKSISTTTHGQKSHSTPRAKASKASGYKRPHLAYQKPWQDFPSKLSVCISRRLSETVPVLFVFRWCITTYPSVDRPAFSPL